MFLSFKAVFFLCFSAGLMVTCTTTKKNSVSEKQKLPVVDPSDQALFEKAFENMAKGIIIPLSRFLKNWLINIKGTIWSGPPFLT